MKNKWLRNSLIFIWILTMGCAHSGPSPNADLPPGIGRQMARMKPIVEDLYLNHLGLHQLYRDLHQVASYHMFAPGDQLGYIQKTALFIQEAYRLGRAQWELLGILEYIRPEAIRDYFTLRAKGLASAIEDVRFTVKEIDLYQKFIEHPEALKICSDAVGMIEANIVMMEKLLDIIRPLTNKAVAKRKPA